MVAAGPGGIPPERVLRELADLWVALGKQGQDEGGAGVLRACTLTLVVLAEAGDDAMALGETIAALMPEHPARAIVVKLSGAGEHALTERVYAQCWMPFGQRRQICCEQIEITASDAALADLPSVVLPLAAPDLPVIVWLRSARLFEMPPFGEIARMAAKVVADSAGFADPKRTLRLLAETARGGVLLGDLAWTRLTRWREMLARLFENRDYLAKLARISSVQVAYDGEFATTAWYMGAWIVDALEDAGVRAKVVVGAGRGPAPLSVELAGGGFRVVLERREDRLVITVDNTKNCTNLPQPGDYLLMREELGIVRRDAVFERTLASAARLAYATD
ncbi:MAG: glucose-6-phosphate dehydrogenase assembly protein OpcA [Bryobacteraceae bacterium]|jgi:glucose-6-phosphate dehydrogenase assembly protein OpcA